jgi:hypothetical protein
VLLDALFVQCALHVVQIHELRALSQTSLLENLDAVNARYVPYVLQELQSDEALMPSVLGNALRATLNARLNELPSLMLLLDQHLNNDELMAYLLQAYLLHLYELLFAQLYGVPLVLLL